MLSPMAEKAIEDAQANGKAILKFISANDAGITGSHQAGFYMPKSAWKLYAPFGPVKGTLKKSKVRIFWQCDRYTDSVVTYYGQNRLYHNRGNGTFQEVTDRAGVAKRLPRFQTSRAM